MFLDCSPCVIAFPYKTCTKCGETKQINAFSRDRRKRDGLRCHCKACVREYNTTYYNNHPDEMRARSRRKHQKYDHKHREEKRAYDQVYRRENAEKRRQYTAEFRKKNPEYMEKWRADNAERLQAWRKSDEGRKARGAIAHRRRAHKVGNGGAYTTDDLNAIRAAQTDRKGRLICWKCGKPIIDTPDLDHWIPISKGGSNDAGNLHYMHATCNRKKGAKMPAEIGRLI